MSKERRVFKWDTTSNSLSGSVPGAFGAIHLGLCQGGQGTIVQKGVKTLWLGRGVRVDGELAPGESGADSGRAA